jgi:chromosome segregation ATPase
MRFQDVYGWRSPRSESEWPAFQQPKADALFLMRVALGLFLPQELKKEESLGKLKRGLEQLEKKIAELEKEPEFRVNLYDRELRDRLQTLLPDKTGVRELPLKSADGLGLFPDLDNTTKEAATKLEIAIAEITNDHNATQATIDDLGGQIRELESKQLALAAR